MYLNAFEEKDHIKLSCEIAKVQTKWIMTYDNVKLIEDLYSNFNQVRFDLLYSVSSKRKEKELMISNTKLVAA